MPGQAKRTKSGDGGKGLGSTASKWDLALTTATFSEVWGWLDD